MKYGLLTALFLFFCTALLAQDNDYEIKVVSKKYQNVKGKLQKVSVEGIAIEDYKGNYLIFKTNELVRLKIRKRGLTIAEGAGGGALVGLGTGAVILSLDKEGEAFTELLTLTGILTGAGTLIGTISGVIAEIINTKLTLNIDGDEEKYKANYKKLVQYINVVYTEHL